MPANTTSPQYDPTKYYQENCGFSNYTHGRVVGGVESEQGAWPWLAALAYKDQETNTFNFACAGALISPKHILTAAHCVFDRNDLIFVRLGEHNIDSEDDGAHPIDVDIAEKVLHPQFNPFTYEYDIAILRLTDAVNYTYEIRPICLPDTQDLESRSLTRSFPFVAGWGTVEYEGLKSSELREVQVPVIDSGDCNKFYRKLRRVIISERVLCAGFAKGGKDACQGDSGGPLMWPRGKTFYIIGIVSIGYKCAIPGFPGLYTRVTYFLDWIKSVTGM